MILLNDERQQIGKLKIGDIVFCVAKGKEYKYLLVVISKSKIKEYFYSSVKCFEVIYTANYDSEFDDHVWQENINEIQKIFHVIN